MKSESEHEWFESERREGTEGDDEVEKKIS